MRGRRIDPGALRHRLSLQRAVVAGDGLGGHVENWSEVALLFGRIEPVLASRGFGAGHTLEKTTHRITMRFRDDVASGMRFVSQGRIHSILTVHDVDETGLYLVCETEETGR